MAFHELSGHCFPTVGVVAGTRRAPAFLQPPGTRTARPLVTLGNFASAATDVTAC